MRACCSIYSAGSLAAIRAPWRRTTAALRRSATALPCLQTCNPNSAVIRRFIGGRSAGDAGAMAQNNGRTSTVRNCTFTGNEAQFGFVAALEQNAIANTRVLGCTFARNRGKHAAAAFAVAAPVAQQLSAAVNSQTIDVRCVVVAVLGSYQAVRRQLPTIDARHWFRQQRQTLVVMLQGRTMARCCTRAATPCSYRTPPSCPTQVWRQQCGTSVARMHCRKACLLCA